MILTLTEAKSYLRVDFDDDDALVQLLIDSAEVYLKNVTYIEEKAAKGIEILKEKLINLIENE